MKEKNIVCGCELQQDHHKEIMLSQERFSLGLNEINLTQERKQQPDDETTPAKKARATRRMGLEGHSNGLVIGINFDFVRYASDSTGSRFVVSK